MKKSVQRDANALRAGCRKAEPKIFGLPQIDPLLGGAGQPKFNQLELFTLRRS